jgi:glycosyltransferase involved in cell wall biosynthesis
VDYHAVLNIAGINDARLKFTSSGRIRSGCGHPRNVGLDLASAPIIACLDADDMLAEDYLETMLPLAETHGFVLVKPAYIDEATGAALPQLVITEQLPSTLTLDHMPLLMLRWGQACVVFDRRRVDARWYTRTHIGEDTLFLLQAFQFVPALHFTQQSRYHYYRHQRSVTHDQEQMAQFTAEKKRLLSHIRAGQLFTHHPLIAAMAEKCLIHSIAAEQEFMDRLRIDSNAEFTDFLAAHFDKAGLISLKNGL